MEPGFCTEAKYIRTVDGDTYVFEVTRQFHIRLEGIDVPEIETKEGQEASNYIKSVFEKAKKILVFIPSNNPLELMDITSFRRLVGRVQVDGQNLLTLLKRKKYFKKNSDKG